MNVYRLLLREHDKQRSHLHLHGKNSCGIPQAASLSPLDLRCSCGPKLQFSESHHWRSQNKTFHRLLITFLLKTKFRSPKKSEWSSGNSPLTLPLPTEHFWSSLQSTEMHWQFRAYSFPLGPGRIGDRTNIAFEKFKEREENWGNICERSQDFPQKTTVDLFSYT